jgi:hypothetical protein
MAGGIFVLLYFAAMGILFAGAGLVDLVLLPFRPLMATTYFVDTIAVDAKRLKGSSPSVHVGHYIIQPPTAGDWYRITALEGAAQSPTMDVPSAPYRGARELFIRNPTARRLSAVRALADSPISMPPEDHRPGAPPKGRIEPAALVRIERLEPREGDTRARLEALIEASRQGPASSGPLAASPGLYQVVRAGQTGVQVGTLTCVRDEFVYLWLDRPDFKGPVSRHLTFTLACADPACPGQVVSLVVRGKADSGGDLERQGRSFLDGFRTDAAVTPVCSAR